jgi:hypothetical protein
MQDEAKKMFFSYARADAEFVLKLAADLRSAGVDLWIDQLDIPAGVQWDRAVEDALEACSCLLLVLSPTSIASQNVMDEASFAIEQDKKILPVLYQNCDIPFRLKRLQYIDFSGDYDIAYTKLLNALTIHSSENVRETPSPKLRSMGMLLDSASISAHKVEQEAGLATRKKEGKPWWRHPAWIGGIAVIIAAVLSSPYLLDLITNGNGRPPIQNSILEQELSKANIILSESEVDVQQVRIWLRSDPSYQALAQSCLKVLAGKRVSDPVPLNVVNGWYREALGYSSDKYVPPEGYNNLGKLKVAIFAAWKERHAGSTQNSFEEIVENVSTTP